MTRIVVCGYMIRHPLAGNVLAYAQYVLGLHRLGHDVLYLEESGWANSCYDPLTLDYGDEPAAGIRTVRSLLAGWGAQIPTYYVDRQTGKVEGAEWAEVKRALA